jgi:hypothetical protein
LGEDESGRQPGGCYKEQKYYTDLYLKDLLDNSSEHLYNCPHEDPSELEQLRSERESAKLLLKNKSSVIEDLRAKVFSMEDVLSGVYTFSSLFKLSPPAQLQRTL